MGMAQLRADPQAKEAWRRVAETGFTARTARTETPPGFRPFALAQELRAFSRALRRNEQAVARLLKRRALSGARDWQAERRARTRHLIELGGLIQKAGLVELVDVDHATGDLKTLWRRRGLRAFDAEAAQASAMEGKRKEEHATPAAE